MCDDKVREGLGTEVLTPATYLRAFTDQLTQSSEKLMAMDPFSIYAIGPASTFMAYVGQIESEILSKPASEHQERLERLVARLRNRLRGRRLPHYGPGMDIEEITTHTASRVLMDLEAILSQLILDRVR